jgi:hypothetical protein
VQDRKSLESYFLEIEEVAIQRLMCSAGEAVVDKFDNTLKLEVYSFHRI